MQMKCEHCYHGKVCYRYSLLKKILEIEPESKIPVKASDECNHFGDVTNMINSPLKIGDTVYRKSTFKSGILEATVQSITINRFGFSFRAVGNHVEFPFDDNDIGKTVFLTPEAAQKALKGEI